MATEISGRLRLMTPLALRTGRLGLRAWTHDDAPRLFDILGRREVTQWLGDGTPWVMADLEEARRAIDRNGERSVEPPIGLWAIEVRETGQVEGSVMLLPLPRAEAGEVEIAWHLHVTQRDAAIDGAGWERVYADVDDNEWADGLAIDSVANRRQRLHDRNDRRLPRPRARRRHRRGAAGADHGPAGRHTTAWGRRDRAVARPGRHLSGDAGRRDGRERARPPLPRTARDARGPRRRLPPAPPPRPRRPGRARALFGINRVWMPHPFHKWLDWEATLLPHRPDRLVERIRSLLVAPPAEAVLTLGGLVDETYALARAHVPAADLDPLRQAFELRRITG